MLVGEAVESSVGATVQGHNIERQSASEAKATDVVRAEHLQMTLVRSPASQTNQAHLPVRFGDDDEARWSEALTEFEGSSRRQGLWAKVFAEASGNDAIAKANYLKVRAHQLADEHLRQVSADLEQATELQRLREVSETELQARVRKMRTDFVGGKRPSAADVTIFTSALYIEPSLAHVTDRLRGESLLHWCAKLNLPREAEALLGAGANPNAPNGEGRRPHELTEDLMLRGLLRSAAHSASELGST